MLLLSVLNLRATYNLLINTAILLRVCALSAAKLLLRGVEALVEVVFFLGAVASGGLLRGIVVHLEVCVGGVVR